MRISASQYRNAVRSALAGILLAGLAAVTAVQAGSVLSGVGASTQAGHSFGVHGDDDQW